jgi:uncharacterized protein involved in response to NO
LTGIGVAVWLELAGYSIGLACCILGIISKAEKRDWKLYVAIIGIVVGSALLVFAGVTEDKIKTLISTIFGLVVLVVSMIPILLGKKEKAAVAS